jgi:hypothetical protein
LADAVICDSQPLRARIFQEVEVLALDGDQYVADRLYDLEGKIETLCLFDRLVPGDDFASAIEQDSTPSTELAKGMRESLTAARCSEIRVVWIRSEIGQTPDIDCLRTNPHNAPPVPSCST